MSTSRLSEDQLAHLILEASATWGIEPRIIHGVIMRESGGDSLAFRYEPRYPYLYKVQSSRPPGYTIETETVLQKCSFGLMQVMGAVFRELGYRGGLTEVLCRPALQLEYGCRHLRPKLDKYGIEDGLSAYNAGRPVQSNRAYVRKVLEFSEQWNNQP
jgi:soluble lytic murein transglycosylase-like protein